MGYSTCAFTGHRHIKSSHTSHIGELIEKSIEYAYSEGCRTFFAGGAIGFDTIAARAVLRLKLVHTDIRLVLCLPCVDQDAMWNEEQRDAYAYTLRFADEVRYVSDSYTPTCMRDRNRMLAESADLVIAYVGRSRSGSSQTAKMAEDLGKTVFNIYPTLERVSEEKP